MERKQFSLLLALIFILSGCVASDVPKGNRTQVSKASTKTTSGSGNGATDTDDDVGNGTSLPPTVELRHLIEPNLSLDLNYTSGTGYAGGGSYSRKLTLPKNFAGRLYLAGINIGTLQSNFVKVRFKFGVGREAVTIPATVSQAPGITPANNISVLVLDLRSEPFRSIRLPYDLYDYNDYDFPGGDTPTLDNRDSELYCRGLKLEDDPTFVGVGACDGIQSNPDQPEEECLYSYASVLDQGLLKQSGAVKVPITPSAVQSKSITGNNYYQDYPAQMLKKPLLDTLVLSAANTIGNYKFSDFNASTGSTAITFTYPTTIWDPVTIGTSQYYFRGPYRLVNQTEWQIKFAQLDGPKRLFRQNSYVDYPLYLTSPLPDDDQSAPTQNRLYYNSYMFPLATKLTLGANVTHLASASPDGVRTETSLATAGATSWMDGANARAQTRNTDNEHVGSCNISATMEILAKDKNGIEFVITESKDVKLQLVRPTQYKTDTGNEVLFSNYKRCTSNVECGGSECCFNNRCWDETLVSQCIDPALQGHKNVGESCTTDFQCTSLCCNRTSGLCAPHNTSLTTPVLCSKPTGEFCIAKEWCQKSPVSKPIIVKTGTDPVGNVTCNQIVVTTQEYGDCQAGVCIPPEQPAIPVFDPNAVGACNNAVPPPTF